MDRSITDANLKDFNIRSRFYRNRRIGEFLKELDLAEGRNTGIGKIVRAMRENGNWKNRACYAGERITRPGVL